MAGEICLGKPTRIDLKYEPTPDDGLVLVNEFQTLRAHRGLDVHGWDVVPRRQWLDGASSRRTRDDGGQDDLRDGRKEEQGDERGDVGKPQA